MADSPVPRVFVTDVRVTTCTRCSTPGATVVAVIWSDLSGKFFASCERCLVLTMDDGESGGLDMHANFDAKHIDSERERLGLPAFRPKGQGPIH